MNQSIIDDIIWTSTAILEMAVVGIVIWGVLLLLRAIYDRCSGRNNLQAEETENVYVSLINVHDQGNSEEITQDLKRNITDQGVELVVRQLTTEDDRKVITRSDESPNDRVMHGNRHHDNLRHQLKNEEANGREANTSLNRFKENQISLSRGEELFAKYKEQQEDNRKKSGKTERIKEKVGLEKRRMPLGEAIRYLGLLRENGLDIDGGDHVNDLVESIDSIIRAYYTGDPRYDRDTLMRLLHDKEWGKDRSTFQQTINDLSDVIKWKYYMAWFIGRRGELEEIRRLAINREGYTAFILPKLELEAMKVTKYPSIEGKELGWSFCMITERWEGKYKYPTIIETNVVCENKKIVIRSGIGRNMLSLRSRGLNDLIADIMIYTEIVYKGIRDY